MKGDIKYVAVPFLLVIGLIVGLIIYLQMALMIAKFIPFHIPLTPDLDELEIATSTYWLFDSSVNVGVASRGFLIFTIYLWLPCYFFAGVRWVVRRLCIRGQEAEAAELHAAQPTEPEKT